MSSSQFTESELAGAQFDNAILDGSNPEMQRNKKASDSVDFSEGTFEDNDVAAPN